MNRLIKSSRKLIRLARVICFSAAAPAVLLAPAVPAQAARSDQLDHAVSALRAISTMRADFVQTDRNGQSVSGVLTLKRPGRIRFEYEKSVPMLIVGDGHALTVIDYEVNQVQRWPIKNSPLGALLDPGRDVSKYGTVVPTGNPDVVSIRVRDTKHPEYGTITLVFMEDAAAPGGMQLYSWVTLDSQNKQTTIRLSNHKYGLSVPDSTFRFRDPRKTGRR